MFNRNVQHSPYSEALSCAQRGDLTSAEKFVKQQLDITPKHRESLNLLARIHFNTKNHPKVIEGIHSIEEWNNLDAEECNLIATSYLETGNQLSAVHYFKDAISRKPDYPIAQYNLGIIYYNQKKYQDALALLLTFTKKNSYHELSELIIGDCYIRLQEFSLAEKVYKKVIDNNPLSEKANIGLLTSAIFCNDHATIEWLISFHQKEFSQKSDILFKLADLLLAHGYHTQSLDLYEQLSMQLPNNSSLLRNLAMSYEALDKNDEAIKNYSKSIAIDNNIESISSLGNLYTNLEKNQLAEQTLLNAIAQDPNYAGTYINLGRLYSFQKEHEKANRFYAKAMALEPNNAAIYYNYANSYRKSGDYIKAKEYLLKCLSIDKTFADAEYNLGLIELMLGEFSSAWGHYFKRLRVAGEEQLSTIIPGMDLSDRHVYFCRSQGIGDELFFLRFLKQLNQQNIEISYRSSDKIFPLLENMTEIDNLLNESSAIPNADFNFAIDDIPLVINMDSIEKIPPPIQFKLEDIYNGELANEILRQKNNPIIGITWESGTPTEQQNRKSTLRCLSKSIDIDCFIDLLNPIDITIAILQRNPKPEDLTYLREKSTNKIIDLSSHNNSLPDMLTILSLIDEYIAVSNTNIHLCAGINKTAKILVPHPPEWRWLTSGDESPWFPRFSVYRQQTDDNWKPALETLKKDLEAAYGG